VTVAVVTVPTVATEEGYSRNRPIEVIRGFSRENVVEVTTSIESN